MTDTNLDKEYLKGLTILYVEDDRDTYELFIPLLSRFSKTVLHGINGAVGLEIYRREFPHIIVTDVQMPMMDGLSMAQEIRTVDRSVPIVVVSAFEQASYLRRALDIGVDKFVTKPTNSNQIYQCLLDCAHRLRIEAQLQESEERFRNLFNDSPDALTLLEGDSFTDGNRAAELLLRSAREQFLGQNPVHFSPEFQPDGRCSAEAFREKTAEALHVGTVSFEWLFQRLDGSRFWADMSLRVTTIQGRQVIICCWRDITARKQAEAKLKSITTTASDAIIMIDSHGLITFWNPAAERIFGYDAAEVIGVNLHHFLAPERYRDVFEAAFPLFRQTGQGNVINTTIELGAIRKDGQEISVELSLSADMHEGEWHAIGVIRDVSGRKKYETELLKLSRAIEQSPVSILMTDTHGDIDFVNPRFTELTGYTAEEVLGKNPRILKSGQTPPARFVELWATIAAGNIWHGELVNRRKDGTLFWATTSVSALRNAQGEIIHYLSAFEDVTERKLLIDELNGAKEGAEAATRAKSSFLSSMSHEIRTPMNGVIGMTDLLLETTLTREQHDFVDTIRKSGENLLELINDILDFSKIEAGKLDLEILDFDPYAMMEDTVDLLALRASEKGLELLCSVDPAIPAGVRGDPGRVRQIITNLAGNAIKFTGSGEIVIAASLKEVRSDHLTVLFEVRDTGIGIPADRLQAVFDPFTQAEGSTTRKFGGTGLGLTICKQLAELMGGEVAVTSEYGVGSTFSFTVCFEKQAADRHKEEGKVIPRPELDGMAILVVDDNSTSRALIRGQLERWLCRAVVAADGERAMELLREAATCQTPFQVVLIDEQMPGCDGFELGSRIKRDLLLSQTRLVLMSALGQGKSRTQLEESGFSGTLAKPVRRSRLCDSLVLSTGTPQGGATNSDSIRTEKSARILLAEDNVINQKVAQKTLYNLGYSVDIASNGREAVTALEHIDYDLVLMDCQMPELDGFEATAYIRNPDSPVLNHRVPIIAMTANAMTEDRDNCLRAGMDDYLSKPIKKEVIAELLHAWLSKEGADGLRS